MNQNQCDYDANWNVSMKSGLGDRNNLRKPSKTFLFLRVSMKSGLGDRNNVIIETTDQTGRTVSMKSGLGDRNNPSYPHRTLLRAINVSMKSGLGDRNNQTAGPFGIQLKYASQ